MSELKRKAMCSCKRHYRGSLGLREMTLERRLGGNTSSLRDGGEVMALEIEEHDGFHPFRRCCRSLLSEPYSCVVVVARCWYVIASNQDLIAVLLEYIYRAVQYLVDLEVNMLSLIQV